MTAPSLIVGVDVGGTFTDLFFLDQRDGKCFVGKVPSTRGDASRGFLDGLRGGAKDSANAGDGRARHHGRHQRLA